jgi:hypothetical protein
MPELNAKYWRDRAAATAAKADRRWIDEREKSKLLRIAREYDKLADAAASRDVTVVASSRVAGAGD